MQTSGARNQSAALLSSQILAASDALRQHMLPQLDLWSLLQLTHTCKAWRQLINDTTIPQLSATARNTLLPSGLTSDLKLLQLAEHQAQLLASLRGKQSPFPRLQCVSFGHVPAANV